MLLGGAATALKGSGSDTETDGAAAALRECSSSNIVTLYHETSADFAYSILRSQTFKCGDKGLVGGGIYFAESKADTRHKAQNRGVILKARVNLGRIKTVQHGNESGVNARTVQKENFDSVRLNRYRGTEYCVYDSSRVTQIERV
jgi:hypothetical protein